MAKDFDLFSAAMASVTPLKGRRPSPPPAHGHNEERRGAASSSSIVRGRTKKAESNAAEFSFDRDIDRALARGKRRPEAKLDLHGMTLASAEQAVSRFLGQASAERRRIVLIVTGKGLRLDGGRVQGGRIRAEFPGWLERANNQALVTGVKAAHPLHGGSGAFYVLLRRR